MILSTPGTTSMSFAWVNLAAVAVGTVKLLAWMLVVTVVAVGAFIFGMYKAAVRQGRRTW